MIENDDLNLYNLLKYINILRKFGQIIWNLITKNGENMALLCAHGIMSSTEILFMTLFNISCLEVKYCQNIFVLYK